MPDVIVMECTTYQQQALTEALHKGMALLGGWDRFVRPGMKVLLKPNLIGPKTSASAAVTHAEMLRAVGRILKSRGSQVWIGDSAGGAIAGVAPTGRAMKIAGYQAMAEEEGFLIKNFEREGTRQVSPKDAPERLYNLAEPLFSADLVINMPKLKTHMSSTYTGAVKNLFGCVPGLRKAEYHRISPDLHTFGAIIADINFCVSPALHIMDGVMAMQGRGPTAGSPYPAGKILMSADPMALDAAACAMLGLSAESLPVFDSARERGLGEWRLDRIRLLGDFDRIPALKRYAIPKPMAVGKLTGRILGGLIDMLKRQPRIDLSACVDCGLCVESCPVHAIDGPTKAIDYTACIQCLCCHELCMEKAVRVVPINRLVAFFTRER